MNKLQTFIWSRLDHQVDTQNSIDDLHTEHPVKMPRNTIHCRFITTAFDVWRYNEQVFHHSNKVNSFSHSDDDAYYLDLKRLLVTHA